MRGDCVFLLSLLIDLWVCLVVFIGIFCVSASLGLFVVWMCSVLFAMYWFFLHVAFLCLLYFGLCWGIGVGLGPVIHLFIYFLLIVFWS